MVHDKDIRLFGYPQYRPDFHLAFRVFVNGLPGFPRTGKSHSFVVKLDNTELEDYIKEGMSQIQLPEGRNTQGRRSPPPKDSPPKNQSKSKKDKRGSLDSSQRGLDSGAIPSYQNLGAGDSTGASASVLNQDSGTKKE